MFRGDLFPTSSVEADSGPGQGAPPSVYSPSTTKKVGLVATDKTRPVNSDVPGWCQLERVEERGGRIGDEAVWARRTAPGPCGSETPRRPRRAYPVPLKTSKNLRQRKEAAGRHARPSTSGLKVLVLFPQALRLPSEIWAWRAGGWGARSRACSDLCGSQHGPSGWVPRRPTLKGSGLFPVSPPGPHHTSAGFLDPRGTGPGPCRKVPRWGRPRGRARPVREWHVPVLQGRAQVRAARRAALPVAP